MLVLIALSACSWISKTDHVEGLARWDFEVTAVQAEWDSCNDTATVVVGQFGEAMPAVAVDLVIEAAGTTVTTNAVVTDSGAIEWTADVPPLPGGLQTLSLQVTGPDFAHSATVEVTIPAIPEVILDADGDNHGGSLGQSCGGDQATVLDDCDDTNAQINPDAVEVCDEVDNDCDGQVDLDDPDILAVHAFADADGDGFGNPHQPLVLCQQGTAVLNDDDCDDTNAAINPHAIEICDDQDSNCNHIQDDDEATDRVTSYQDADSDGHGNPHVSQSLCTIPDNWVEQPDDCEDLDNLISPSSQEICDGIDNNCSGLIDSEDHELTGGVDQYVDADGDGFGTGAFVEACEGDDGYSDVNTDCNDHDGDINPHEFDYCNGIDEDCDPLTPGTGATNNLGHEFATLGEYLILQEGNSIDVCGELTWPDGVAVDSTLTINGMPGATITGQIIAQSNLIVEDVKLIPSATATEGGALVQQTNQVQLRGVEIDCTNVENVPARGGAAFVQAGTLILSNSTIHACTADDGGAIYLGANTTLSHSDGIVEIFDNVALGDGGGVYALDAQITSNGVGSFVLRDNQAVRGGGAMIEHTVAQSSQQMTGLSLVHNLAEDGGGLAFEGVAPLRITADVLDNTANNNGGGLFVVAGGVELLEQSMVVGNAATNDGGGLWSAGPISANHGIFQGNIAGRNGGAFRVGDSLDVEASEFSENQAATGGAVFAEQGSTLTIGSSRFTTNIGFVDGGAIFLDDAQGTIAGEFDTNVAQSNDPEHGVGGAIGGVFRSHDRTVTIESSSFQYNQGQFGGAVGVSASGSAVGTHVTGGLVLSDSQFITNTANSGGALYGEKLGVDFHGDVLFQGNQADSLGGGMFWWDGQSTGCNGLTGVNSILTFMDNTGHTSSGGALIGGCPATLNEMNFSGNQAPTGSALRISRTFLSVSSLTAFGNSGGPAVVVAGGGSIEADTASLGIPHPNSGGNTDPPGFNDAVYTPFALP